MKWSEIMELDDKQRAMLEQVQWNDDNERTARLDGDDLTAEIEECADKIVAVVKASMNKRIYNGEEVIIPLPVETHSLLGRMLAPDLAEDSQESVLNVLRHVIFSKAWTDREVIENKINTDVIPVDKSLKHRHAIENLWLHINLDDDDCPIIDYTSDSDANRNLNELMGLGLPDDHIREQAKIQGKDNDSSLMQIEVTLRLEPNPEYDPSYDPGRSVEEGTIVATDRGATFKNS